MNDFNNLKNKIILVTGGAGFIGSNLCERLLKIGSKVKCLDNFSTGHKKNIFTFLNDNNFQFIEGDIRNIDICQMACQNVDYVLHQAALGSVPRSINDPISTNEVNINGFLNMLSQELRIKELLPVSLDEVSVEKEASSMLDIEPDDDEEILNELTAKYVDFNMYYSLIDSLAAEHSARMQAMDNATNNAKERVNDLTVEFNKARQAAITTELIEIISGVESMK